MPHASIRRILIAVDGSQNAMDAVRYVGKTLPAKGVQIVLFHVVAKIPDSFWDAQKEPAYQYRIADIKTWEEMQERNIIEFLRESRRILVETGVPDHAIVERVQERKAGIARDIIQEAGTGYHAVVLGRRGVSQLKDLILGSIALKLLEGISEVPVWVVGGGMQRGKVLVALDNSEGAMRAVDHVASTLNDSDWFQVTLYHAVRGLDILQGIYEKGIAEALQKDWKTTAEMELESRRQEMEPVFREARERLVAAGMNPRRIQEKLEKGGGSRAGCILEEAENGAYDTIVVGRRGLSRVQEFFMGRVSNKVVQLAGEQTVWVVS
ncbi:MAG: universal stress protein [Deltaproteobacteria bacterium]|nr:universal stress protein [Deltaproteobacteria bacterium]